MSCIVVLGSRRDRLGVKIFCACPRQCPIPAGKIMRVTPLNAA
jgi:hypothetical protein